MRRLAHIAAVLGAAFAFPATAAAQSINAPPGNSAVDQYQESVPDASGNRPSRSATSKGTDTTPVLDPATSRELERGGAAGAQLVAVTEATGVSAPKRLDKPGDSADPAPGGTATDFSSDSRNGSSPLTSVAARSLVGADGSGGGMGIALPVLLLLTAAAGIGYSLRRRPEAL